MCVITYGQKTNVLLGSVSSFIDIQDLKLQKGAKEREL